MPWTSANEKPSPMDKKNSASPSAIMSGPKNRKNIMRGRFNMLRAKYAAVQDKATLDPVLEAAGCLSRITRLKLISSTEEGVMEIQNTRPR